MKKMISKWKRFAAPMPLNTLCNNRMCWVRGVKGGTRNHTGVASWVRRGHAGWGGSSGFWTNCVLLLGRLRKLWTAFRTGWLPASKRVGYLSREIFCQTVVSMFACYGYLSELGWWVWSTSKKQKKKWNSAAVKLVCIINKSLKY